MFHAAKTLIPVLHSTGKIPLHGKASDGRGSGQHGRSSAGTWEPKATTNCRVGKRKACQGIAQKPRAFLDTRRFSVEDRRNHRTKDLLLTQNTSCVLGAANGDNRPPTTRTPPTRFTDSLSPPTVPVSAARRTVSIHSFRMRNILNFLPSESQAHTVPLIPEMNTT